MIEKSTLKVRIREVQDQIGRALWEDTALDNPRLLELNRKLDSLIVEWMRYTKREYEVIPQ